MSPEGVTPQRADALLGPVNAWPRLAGAFALAAGALVLAGWGLDIAALKAPLPGLPSMKANTALCFALLGAGLLLREGAGWRARAAVGAAAVALAIGALTLAEYLAGVDLGIDEALVRDDVAAIATSSPGRMSALTATSFLLCGGGLLVERREHSGVAREGCGAAVLAIATFVLGSYAYGAPLVSTYTQVAPHTAATFLLLGPGLILARDTGPLARLLRSPDIDGQLARRLFPAAVAVPLLVGFARIQLQDQGLVDTSTGAALFAALMAVALGAVATLALLRLQVAVRLRDAALAAERAASTRLRLASAEREAFFARNLDMMAIVGFDGRFREMNPAWQATLGHPLAAMLGKPFLDFVHPDDVERTKAEAGRLSATGRPNPFENRYRRADGTYAWLRWTSTTSTDLQVFLATAHDITQEREAERRLREAEQRTRESESRLRTIFANSPVGIVLTRPDGTVLDLNPAAEALWGLARSAFLDPSFRMDRLYADPQERAALAQALQRDGSARDHEVRMLRGDGQVRRMSFNVSALELAGERVLLAAAQDLTPLRQSEERFERVFRASPVAICLSREDGRFVDANDAFCALVARPRETLLDGSVKAMDVWEDPQERQRMLLAIRQRGLVHDLELRLKRPDGEVRTTLASIEFIDLGGGTTILSMLQDITERLRMQDEREQRKADEVELDRLRRTDAFRNEFINSIAHELATPLTPSC